MHDTRLLGWGFGQLIKGQSALAHHMKMLIYKTDLDCFDTLNFEDDRFFLDPRLFAHFAFPEAQRSLGQVCDDITQAHSEQAQLCHQSIDLFNGALPITLPVIHAVRDAEHNPPVATPPQITAVETTHLQHLRDALALIERHCPWVAQALGHVVRAALLYRASKPRSFAALQAHGMVFLNVPAEADVSFFLEDMARQGAHLVLTGITRGCGDHFLRIAPSTRWCDLSTDAEANCHDERSLDRTLRSIISDVVIAEVLQNVSTNTNLTPQQKHEIQGRLALTVRQFAVDMCLMSNATLYTPRGRMLYRRLHRILRELVQTHGPMIRRFDFSNQAENFCYRRFAARNPLDVDAHRAEVLKRSSTSAPNLFTARCGLTH